MILAQVERLRQINEKFYESLARSWGMDVSSVKDSLKGDEIKDKYKSRAEYLQLQAKIKALVRSEPTTDFLKFLQKLENNILMVDAERDVKVFQWNAPENY